MSLLAHFSDLHLIEMDHHKRSRLLRNRLRLLSFYAPDIDFLARYRRVEEALALIKRVGADHVLVTGDLTEDGMETQFEVLSELLHNSGIAPEKFTLVPGNHDAYHSAGAWDRALAGPLRDFLASSDEPVVLPNAVVIPVSTMIERQVFMRAQGIIKLEDLARVRKIYANPEFSNRAIVMVQHHPPRHYILPPLEWFDGVHNAAHLKQMLMERPRLHVVHGHLHYSVSTNLMQRGYPQLLSTYSTRDDSEHKDSVRFYKADQGALHPLSHEEAANYYRRQHTTSM